MTLAGLIAVLTAALAPAADADTRTLTPVTDGTFGADPASPAKLVRASEDWSRVFFQTAEVMAASDTDPAGNRSAARQIGFRVRGRN